jgi:nitroreductase
VELMQAINERHAVRSYTDKKVPRETVLELLLAAVQAPSDRNSQPWAFAVVQDSALLRSYSERAKAHVLRTGKVEEHIRELAATPEFDMFYRASTLVLICGRRDHQYSSEECALAAENLMLAACALELGTCPIGLARSFFNLPEVKLELGVSESWAPVFPIIVGVPRIDTAPMPRDEPRILCWKS